MAISGIETLRQLGLLGKANLKAEKSLTAWGVTSASKCDCQRLSRMFVVFLMNTHEENKVRLLLKDSQW